MPEVSLYVAMVTAAAGVGGAAIPAIAVIMRDVRQAERDRRERTAEAKRQACLGLLSAAGELRARVADNTQYTGDQLAAWLAGLREGEAAVHLSAANVALLAPQTLADPADHLARAAGQLAAKAAKDTDNRSRIVPQPDFTGFDESVAAFLRKAVANAPA
ncbi:MAG: hypothetical protein QOJ73_7073 [Streptosporangiaceae bacterium]|nr:hypothetical protein [Streptosporangiaceae bacterium]